jgi:hypothetical protein
MIISGGAYAFIWRFQFFEIMEFGKPYGFSKNWLEVLSWKFAVFESLTALKHRQLNELESVQHSKINMKCPTIRKQIWP